MIATDAAGGAVPHPTATFLSGAGRKRQGGATKEVSVQEAQSPAVHVDTRRITVLIAASGVQEYLGPRQVAAAIAEGVHAAIPTARVLQVPIADGCEGFMEEMVGLSAGTIEHIAIVGLHREPATARLGIFGRPAERTAVIGIDESVNLRRLAPDRRDPTGASSRGVGQLITAALDRGVRRIIVGCGDSGANDGGIGMATALGVRFLDVRRTEIVEAGGLQRLDTIDMSHRDRRLDHVSIEVIVNLYNDLLGEHGVSGVYARREGASQAQVLRLENGLARYADVVRRALGIDVTMLRGGGAAGGLGAGLVAFTGASLCSRLDFLRHCPGLETSIAAADLVIISENCIDEQTAAAEAKAPALIAQQAKALGRPVIVLAGPSALDADQAFASGNDASTIVAPAPCNREQALTRAVARLRDASASAMHRVMDGFAKGYGGNLGPRLQPSKETA